MTTVINCDKDTIIPCGNGSCSDLSKITKCRSQAQVYALSGDYVEPEQVCWNDCAKACVAPNSTNKAISQVM